MNKTYKIVDPIYSTDIVLVIGSREYLKKVSAKKFKLELSTNPTSAGICFFVEGDNGRTYNLIWFAKNDWLIKDYGIIAHECLHAAMRGLESIDFKLDYDNQEPLVYYFEFIYQSVLKKLHFKKGKKK